MPRKPRSDIATLEVRGIPRNLRDAFKAHCCLRDMTMRDKITNLIRSVVKGTAPSRYDVEDDSLRESVQKFLPVLYQLLMLRPPNRDKQLAVIRQFAKESGFNLEAGQTLKGSDAPLAQQEEEDPPEEDKDE